MTRSMAQELAGYRITANSIGPGLIATPFGGGTWTDERKAAAGAGIPLGRVGAGRPN